MPPGTGVQVQLGERERTLRYTQPSLRKLQNECGGATLVEILRRAAQLSAHDITALVWAGLLHEDRRLTMSQVDELIEPPLVPLVQGVSKALEPWMAGEQEMKDPPSATAS